MNLADDCPRRDPQRASVIFELTLLVDAPFSTILAARVYTVYDLRIRAPGIVQLSRRASRSSAGRFVKFLYENLSRAGRAGRLSSLIRFEFYPSYKARPAPRSDPRIPVFGGTESVDIRRAPRILARAIRSL